jgi:hypothetical protein
VRGSAGTGLRTPRHPGTGSVTGVAV